MAHQQRSLHGLVLADEESVLPVIRRTRLRGLHFEPARGPAAGVGKTMQNTRANQPEITGADISRLRLGGQSQIAFQNVKALFERVDVRPNNGDGIKKADPYSHVHRAYRTIDVGSSPKADAVVF